MAEGKTKVIAKTVIHRTLEVGKPGDKSKGIRPTPPKVQIIQPKTVFMTRDKAEYDALLEAGAIREPEKGEKVAVDIENVNTSDDTGSGAKKTAAKKTTNTTKSTKTTKAASGGAGSGDGEGSGSGDNGGSGDGDGDNDLV